MPKNQSRVILFTHQSGIQTAIWKKVLELYGAEWEAKGVRFGMDHDRLETSLSSMKTDEDKRKTISEFVFYKCHNMRIALAFLEANFGFPASGTPTFDLKLFKSCPNTHFILFSATPECVAALNSLRGKEGCSNFQAFDKGKMGDIKVAAATAWEKRSKPDGSFAGAAEIYSSPASLKYFQAKNSVQGSPSPWEYP